MRVEGDRVLLRVLDSGAGIAPELVDHLFEPFTQGPQSLARSAGGLGLGLATVRGLVELHGGTVAIASAGVGSGTEVTVTLPRAAGPAADPRAPAATGAPRRRILVIDDNVDAATSLQDVLETNGHLVRIAHGAVDGLAQAAAFRPEILICDLGLPGIDGYEIARSVRADERLRSTYLIALSGYARPEDVQRSIDAGFDRHVAKPPDLERLEALFADASTPPHAAGPDPSPR